MDESRCIIHTDKVFILGKKLNGEIVFWNVCDDINDGDLWSYDFKDALRPSDQEKLIKLYGYMNNCYLDIIGFKYSSDIPSTNDLLSLAAEYYVFCYIVTKDGEMQLDSVALFTKKQK